MTLLVGVDVGGTFTDVFALNPESGEARVAKVPTSRPDQAAGFLAGIGAVAETPAELATVVHGTTAGTNALLERKGAKTGVITTKGLRDVLEMRRRDRPRTWGLRGDFDPPIPRDLRLEVGERTLADGTTREPVDVDAVREAAKALEAKGCTAVALLFAHSYANPSQEKRAAEELRQVWPNEHVSVSHEILPEIREFERFSTTALNAYLQPEVSGYLARLDAALRDGGFTGEFLIVQSNGGVMSAETARAHPIRTALSGPAAGVIAAARVAEAAGMPDVITGDVGGTSFDVSLVAGGQSNLAAQAQIDFGMVIRQPMIEITTIGAGGGSIAWVDKGGLLRIGPESAGSTPGPVAYGRGNTRPTVTDAHVVLGRIDAEAPIGGGLERLDVAAARAAIDAEVGGPLGLSTEAAAQAILRVTNAAMAGAIRLVSIERGHDPTRFAFMPFGGGGALHAGALMDEVGLARTIVPRYPGVTSALGCVIADMRQDFVQTVGSILEGTDLAALASRMQAHHDDGTATIVRAATPFDKVDTEFSLDMAYVGQTHTVEVPIEAKFQDGAVVPVTAKDIAAAFDKAYLGAYGRLLPEGTRRVVNLRTAVTGRRPRFDLMTLAPEGGSVEGARKGDRLVHFGSSWETTAIYDRLSLPVGAVVEGPAILVQPDTTVVVDPGLRASQDAFGNTILTRKEAKQ